MLFQARAERPAVAGGAPRRAIRARARQSARLSALRADRSLSPVHLACPVRSFAHPAGMYEALPRIGE
jgi:hypothetical protein